jgi:hypothetical protein
MTDFFTNHSDYYDNEINEDHDIIEISLKEREDEENQTRLKKLVLESDDDDEYDDDDVIIGYNKEKKSENIEILNKPLTYTVLPNDDINIIKKNDKDDDIKYKKIINKLKRDNEIKDKLIKNLNSKIVNRKHNKQNLIMKYITQVILRKSILGLDNKFSKYKNEHFKNIHRIENELKKLDTNYKNKKLKIKNELKIILLKKI